MRKLFSNNFKGDEKEKSKIHTRASATGSKVCSLKALSKQTDAKAANWK